MAEIRAVYVTEGSSDTKLKKPLEALLISAGAENAVVRCPDLARLPRPPGRRLVDKIAMSLKLEPDANLLFVHRDADGPDPKRRYQEIEHAITQLNAPPLVCVVPVHALEAWLLLDAGAILRACGRPPGVMDLRLPKDPEGVARPKQCLQELLTKAKTGMGRRRRGTITLPRARAQLLDVLDPLDERLMALTSWKRLVDDVRSVVTELGEARPR